MTDKVVDLSVSIKREIPVSQGFWYDLGEGNEEKFLNLIDDKDTRDYFKSAIMNLRLLENRIINLVDWF